MKFSYLRLSGAFVCMALLIASCSKQDATVKPLTSSTNTTAISKDSVLTPFGMRHKSMVHHLESGAQLSYQGDHLVRIDSKSHQMMEDYGAQQPLKTGGALSPNFGRSSNVTVPTLGSGWITYAADPSPISIGGFTTQWVVPANPPTNHGQLLYIFNGLQDGFTATSHILQPVLQYGNNGAWGGNYWTIDNWYASCGTCAAFYGTAITVASGTTLVGQMSQTAVSGSNYSYLSRFYNITSDSRIHYYADNNSVTVTNAPQLQYAFETLEAYNVQITTDYPNGSCNMTSINMYLNTGGRRPTYYTPNWIAYAPVTDVGQHTTVVSPAEVDLYFH